MKVQRLDRGLSIAIALLLAAVLGAAGVLFAALFRYDQGNRSRGELYPVAIEGSYSEEGGPWKPFTPKTDFDNKELRSITLRGHFTRALPAGAALFMNVDHMWVTLRVNGEEVFRLAPAEGDGNPTRALGKQWVTFVSPGITVADEVELSFGNLYWNAYMIQFDELLRHMHTGDARMMLFEAMREDAWTLGIGAVFLFLTLFLLVAALCCGALRVRGALHFLWLGLASLFSALWFFTLSPAPTLIFPWPVLLNVLYSFSMQGMAVFLTMFAAANVSGWRRRLLLAGEGVLLLTLLLGVVNQLFRVQDLYSAINYFSVFDLAVALCIVFCLGYEALRMKRKASAQLLTALLPLVLSAVIELINGYVQFCKAAILLGCGLILFFVMVGVYTLRRIQQSMENEKRMLAMESELSQSRTAVMLSQIQPHFLYNALNTIMNLCYTDPDAAGRSVANFAKYLRGNLDALTTRRLIPFEQELEHLKHYLGLEQLRFPDVRVAYDLQAGPFVLPPLTLQPLVENAIRYGVTRRAGGGTVTVASRESATHWTVTVQDDGVGFDSALPPADGRNHVGLANTRERLAALCGGTLAVKSAPGAGTTVTVSIPKKEAGANEGPVCGR